MRRPAQLAAVALRMLPEGWTDVVGDVAQALEAAHPGRDTRFALLVFLTVLPEEFASPKLPAETRCAPMCPRTAR